MLLLDHQRLHHAMDRHHTHLHAAPELTIEWAPRVHNSGF
jgi:hypothetical protein